MTDQARAMVETDESISENTSKPMKRYVFLVLFLAIAFIAGLRIWIVSQNPFPINGGGFYYQAALDLQANNLRMPVEINYNTEIVDNEFVETIPFALPPLPIFIVAGLSSLFNWKLIDVFRWYPLVASLLTIPYMYVLMRDLLETDREALLGTFVFAVLPMSTIGFIGGDDIATVTALLTAVPAAHMAFQLFHQKDKPRLWLILTIFFTTATFLSHLDWGIFCIISILVALATGTRSIRTFSYMLIILVMVGLFLLPWFWSISKIHSFEPFGNYVLNWFDLRIPFLKLLVPYEISAPENMFSILPVLGFIGVFIALAHKQTKLVIWLFVLMFFLPISAIYVSAIPFAAIIAIALDYLLLTGIASFRLINNRRFSTRLPWFTKDWAITVSYISIVLVLLYPLLGMVRASQLSLGQLNTLTAKDRAAMAWINAGIDEGQFILITGNTDFTTDPIASWFPVLTGLSSLNTIEATDWLGSGEFDQRIIENAVIQACAIGRSICEPENVPIMTRLLTERVVAQNVPPATPTPATQSTPVTPATSTTGTPAIEPVCVMRGVPFRYNKDAQAAFNVNTVGRQTCLPDLQYNYIYVAANARTRLSNNLEIAENTRFDKIYDDGVVIFRRRQ